MKPLSGIVLAFLFAATLGAAPPQPVKGAEAMEKMKGLVGVWEGNDGDGNMITLSYRLVSNGTTLMETLDNSQEKESMITMYHLDGGKLMMTHYCSMGNQPRMRLMTMTPTSLTFSFFDGTNLASKDDPHMHRLAITWVDKDHINEEWTMRSGKDTHAALFKLERKS